MFRTLHCPSPSDRFKPAPAPSPGVMDRLSSAPAWTGAGLAVLLFLSVAFAICTLSGCNASVEARSHPKDTSTASTTPAANETVSTVKTTVTTKTATNPDGSKTITTTTCTCDGKACIQKVDVRVVPATPPTTPPTSSASPIPGASDAVYTLDTSKRPRFGVDLDSGHRNAVPDTTLALALAPLEAEPEPDFTLAIAASDPATARRVVLSQEDASVQVTLDATNLNKAETIQAAKEAVSALAELAFPTPGPDAKEVKVSARVDSKYLVTVTTPLRAGEKPEDASARLKRWIATSGGIFDEAYRRERKANPTTSASRSTTDTKGRPKTV